METITEKKIEHPMDHKTFSEYKKYSNKEAKEIIKEFENLNPKNMDSLVSFMNKYQVAITTLGVAPPKWTVIVHV